MKSIVSAAVLILLAPILRGENFTLRVHETVAIEIPGVTAAYAIDPSLVDVTTSGPGHVSITGRSTGTTQLVAVTISGSQSFLITVGPSRTLIKTAATASGAPTAVYDGNYSSSTAQVRNGFDVFTNDPERKSQFHVLNVHNTRERLGQSSNSFPSIFYEVTTPTRRWTLLDSLVDISPLTIRSTQIRGFHEVDRNLEIHAGYAASSMYEDLFLPADRRWVAGASYGIGQGKLRWIPGIYSFFSEPPFTAARRGTVGSLAMEYRDGLHLFTRTELAVSRSVAGATEIRADSDRDHLHGQLFYKPDDFPTIGLGDLPGTHGEVDWAHRASKSFSTDSYATYDRFRLLQGIQTMAVGNIGLREALSPSFTLLSGVSGSVVETPTASFHTIAVPLGLAFDLRSFGLAALYRIQETSNTSRRGDALRLSTRMTAGAFHASAWAERQRQAPTVDLIFREDPALELALLRLGISVRSPEDIARVLRDNAALINLGLIEGITVNLEPRRLQGGFDAGWLSAGDSRDQLRLHTIFDRAEGIVATRDTLLSTLTYSRRFGPWTDLYGSYTWWRTRLAPVENHGTSFEAGLRQRINVPTFLQRRGTIHGVVFLDPEMVGTRGAKSSPLPGIEVVLDGTSRVKTDASGAYSFSSVASGTHRVAAQLPASRPAFFTTPSHAEIEVPAQVDFGLVWTPARVTGRIVSDANLGIAGVVLTASSEHGRPMTTTSDSDGQFSIDLIPGTYRVEMSPESIPPGYQIAGATERTLVLEADRPQQTSFELRALRSIAGTAGPASPVTLEPIGRTVTADAAGNFVFRSLPSGTFTIVSQTAGRPLSQTVTLPAEPTALQGITLAPATTATASAGKATPPPATAATPPAPAAVPGPVPATVQARAESEEGGYRLQVGAFRMASNVVAAQREVERLGYTSSVIDWGSLQLVTVGPFPTRSAAEEQERRLAAAGIESVILTGRALQMPVAAKGPSFVVQVGAFREPANASQMIRRLRRVGTQGVAVPVDGFTLVRIGPFPSRAAATAAGSRLRSAGFDALVMARAMPRTVPGSR